MEDQNNKKKTPYYKLVRRRRILTTACVLVGICLAIFLFFILKRYDDYETEKSIDLDNAQRTQYEDFNNHLLSYNLDGASLMDYSGNIIWNSGYEMQDPSLEVRSKVALIYDKQGTLMKIFSKDGLDGTIRTALPITAASISEKKTIAVIMQDADVAHIELYKDTGDVLATGEMHLADSGYPISLSLSSDGSRLAVSALRLMEGATKSEVMFYDFNASEKKYENHRVKTYSFSNMVIPQIAYVKNDKLLAIGNSEVIIFNNRKEPEVEKELFVNEEIRSVFYNQTYFGMIVNEQKEDGEVMNSLKLYNMQARERFAREIDQPFTICKIMHNNEILLTDTKTTSLYNTFGTQIFNYSFTDAIRHMIPGNGYMRYYLIQDKEMRQVRLR